MQARNIKVICLHLVFLALYSALFLSVDVPALTDYPNHLARMYVATHYSELPELQQFYYVKNEIAPYMGIDAFFYAFSFLDIYTVSKLFLLACFTLITLGVIAVNYALFGRLRYESLLCYPFFLNLNLSVGQVNYYFCTGFVLIGFAAWLMLEGNRKYIFLFLYSILLFFIHLFALGIMMLLIGLQLLTTKQLNLKTIAKMLGCCVVPVLVLVFLTTRHELPAEIDTSFADLSLLSSWKRLICSVSGLGSASVGIFTFIFYLLITILRLVKFERIGFLILALIPISIAIPQNTYGIWTTDIRLPYFIGLLFACSAHIAKPRAKYFIIPVYILLTLFTLFTSYGFIQIHSSYVDEYRQAVKDLPKGSKLLPIGNLKSSVTNSVPTLAIIESHAFVPDVFTGIPPLKVKKEYENISTPIGLFQVRQEYLMLRAEDREKIIREGEKLNISHRAFYFLNWRNDFDYVVIFQPLPDAKLPAELELIKNGKIFALYKVRKDI